MECRDFQSLIDNFLKDDIDEDDLKDFVLHALECKECYDELEIYFTLQVGLEMAESNHTPHLNFKQELENILMNLDKRITITERIERAKNIIVTLTEVVISITAILCIMHWL